LEQAREIELNSASAASLGYLGRAAQFQGRYAAALTSYDEGLRALDGLGDDRGLVEFTLARAETFIELGLPDEAGGDLKRADARLGTGQNHDQRAEWLRLTARIRARGNDVDGARASLARARKEAQASGSAAVLLRVDVDLAVLLLDEGRASEA